MPTLLEQVAGFENLVTAFRRCSRGKRGSVGYQRAMFDLGENLLAIRGRLLDGRYVWGGYREFLVRDPKLRCIMAAPFMDRVVHTAIHQVIEPVLDPLLPEATYACRIGKGNRLAASDLLRILRKYGARRFVVKLDVAKYFDSVRHEVLLEKLRGVLPDGTLEGLLLSLLRSSPQHAAVGRGIPIGNLTSQAFANFYLVSADHVAISHLDGGIYLRYMDDMVLGGRKKAVVLDAAQAVVEHADRELHLSIPYFKRMPLGNAPVPFLGYVLDHTGYRVLSRNKRRFSKRMKRLERMGARPSRLAQAELSFKSFVKLI